MILITLEVVIRLFYFIVFSLLWGSVSFSQGNDRSDNWQLLFDKAVEFNKKKEISRADSVLNSIQIDFVGDPELRIDYWELKARVKSRLFMTDSALIFYRKVLAFSISNNHLKRQHSTYKSMSVLFKRLSQYDSAIFYIDEVIRLDSLNKDQGELANSLKYKAEIFIHFGQTKKAVTTLKQVLQIRLGKGDLKGVMSVKLRMGRLFMNVDENESAEAYMNEALTIAQELNDSVALSNIYYRKTILYLQWDGKLNLAEKSNNLGFNYSDSIRRPGIYGQLLLHKAKICLEKEDYSGAKFNINRSYRMYTKNRPKTELSKIFLFKARMYYLQDSLAKANIWIDSALTCVSYFHDPFIRITIYQQKALIASYSNDQEEYEKYNNLYLGVKDSISGIENLRAVLDHELEIAEEDQERRLKEIDDKLKSEERDRANSEILFWSVLAISLLIAIVISFYLLKLIKKRRQDGQLKLKLESELDKKESLIKQIEKEGQVPKEDLPAHFESLSKREKEVFDLLVMGKTDKEIAEVLFISLPTVRTHIRHIYEKFHIKSRMEAKDISLKYNII